MPGGLVQVSVIRHNLLGQVFSPLGQVTFSYPPHTFLEGTNSLFCRAVPLGVVGVGGDTMETLPLEFFLKDVVSLRWQVFSEDRVRVAVALYDVRAEEAIPERGLSRVGQNSPQLI